MRHRNYFKINHFVSILFDNCVCFQCNEQKVFTLFYESLLDAYLQNSNLIKKDRLALVPQFFSRSLV